MKPIKVLMVTVAFGEGSGVNSFIINYFRRLDHDKVRMDVLTYAESRGGRSPYVQEVEDAGGKVFVLPSVKDPAKHINAIKKILEEGKYDIVHNNCLLISIPLMYVCKKAKIKVRLQHSHSIRMGATSQKNAINNLFVPLLLINCNYFSACTTAAGKAMFGKRKFHVLPNVINAEEYYFDPVKREEGRAAYGISDKILILSVGRASEEKNPVFAMEVVKRLKEKGYDVLYWWLGHGRMLEEMKSKAAEMGITEITSFPGNKSNVRDYYEIADLFFLPSIFEGLPLTGLEAQAMGLPAVVSDIVTREMLFTDLVEYVSLKEPIEKWVEAFERQIKRIPERKSCNEELRRSPYSAENAGRRMEVLYEELLAEK